MPIYEYACSECGHQLEAIQKVSDPPLTECPSCGGETLKKQISKVAFRLKGTGWYETDFKDKKTNKSKADGDKSGDGDKGESKKSDAKSDSKSDSGETKKASASKDAAD